MAVGRLCGVHCLPKHVFFGLPGWLPVMCRLWPAGLESFGPEYDTQGVPNQKKCAGASAIEVAAVL